MATNQTLVHMPTCYLQNLLGRSLFRSLQEMVENLVPSPYTLLWSTMEDGIFSLLDADHFTFLPGLPRPSQKGKHWSQYELGVVFSRTLYGIFFLNNNLWDNPSFMLAFTCFFTTTRSPVSNFLMSLTLLRSSLCLILLSDTGLLNTSIYLNRSRDADSNWLKDCCTSEIPSLDLADDRSIGYGNSLPIDTTYREMSVPSTGPAFQAYSANNTPYNHWWRLTLYIEFIFCTLSKYIQNPSFIITLRFPLATACTGISNVSWKVSLKIPGKIPSTSTTIVFGSPNETRKFPKYHRAA